MKKGKPHNPSNSTNNYQLRNTIKYASSSNICVNGYEKRDSSNPKDKATVIMDLPIKGTYDVNGVGKR